MKEKVPVILTTLRNIQKAGKILFPNVSVK